MSSTGEIRDTLNTSVGTCHAQYINCATPPGGTVVEGENVSEDHLT